MVGRRGAQLAFAVKEHLDPLEDAPEEEPDVPIYTMPNATQFVLPNGMHYLHFEGPKAPLSLAVAANAPDYVRTVQGTLTLE